MKARAPVTASNVKRRRRGRPSVEDTGLIDDEILRVALEQFVRHGYSISMTRIVAAAGTSKATMYSRFSGKEQLFRAMIHKQIARVAEAMPLGEARAADLESGLRNYADRTLQVSLEREFIEVNRLIHSEARRFPELAAAAAERNALGIAQLSAFIRHRAELDCIPCRDPETIAECLIYLMRGWYMNAMLSDDEVPPEVRHAWVARAVRTLVLSRLDW